MLVDGARRHHHHLPHDSFWSTAGRMELLADGGAAGGRAPEQSRVTQTALHNLRERASTAV